MRIFLEHHGSECQRTPDYNCLFAGASYFPLLHELCASVRQSCFPAMKIVSLEGCCQPDSVRADWSAAPVGDDWRGEIERSLRFTLP